MIDKINAMGISHYPICIAKTQYSFSADAKAYGVPKGFKINIRDIVINCGAEMLVLIAGDIMRMPGLPKSPQAERIDLTPEGEIDGLS
jgi:formate--tetrahydrofolate ligase